MNNQRKPLKTFDGYGASGLQIAVWSNDNGVSFTIQKRYKDKHSDEWKETKSFFMSDIVALSMLSKDAAAWASKYNKENRSKQPVDQGGSKSSDMTFEDDEIPF